MKKLLAILLLAATSLFGQSITGSGTDGDPWVIYTAEHFDSVAILGVGVDHAWELGNDIDFGSYGVWDTPIMDMRGTFQGNGYTISNLTLGYTGTTTRWSGLFGETGITTGGNEKWWRNVHLNNVKLDFDTVFATTAHYIGALVAEIDWPFWYMADCSVVNFQDTLFIMNNEVVRWGGLIGSDNWAGSGSFSRDTIIRCIVDSITFVQTNASAGQSFYGGVVGQVSKNINYLLYFDKSAAKNVFIHTQTAASWAGGIYGDGGKYGYIRNSYSYDVRILAEGVTSRSWMSNGTLLGSLGNTTGAVLTFSYTGKGGIRHTQMSDTLESGLIGYSFTYDDVADTTMSWYSDSTFINTNNKDKASHDPTFMVGGPFGRTIEQMKDSSFHSGKGWDFVNIWGITTSFNEGFPYLLWEDPPQGIPVLDYPNAAGLFFTEHDTLTILWTPPSDSTSILWQMLEYSIDGGASWTLLDTLTNLSDSTYNWIIPDEPTSLGYIKITTDLAEDSSDNAFTILTSSILDIIYPIEKEGVSIYAGDTLHVNMESQFVANIWLYWSKDSLNWSFIDSMAVDTVNGQWLDTTNYVWTFDGTVSGPEIWVKAEEQADTNLYVFEENYIEMGRGYPFAAPFICQTPEGLGFIEQLVLYDPSCGWSSPPHSWYNGILSDFAETRTWTENTCEHPYTDPECTYPRLAHVWLVTGSDTTELGPDLFYGAPAATVVYQGRSYYILDDTLWNNDLVNGIDSIFVSDLTSLYGSTAWTAGDELLQVYQVQYSKVISDTVNSTDDFESLNDVGFEPKILIGVSTYPQSTISLNALGYPANADPASDTQKILTGSSFNRFFFRGIHPKIDKDR